MVYLSPITNIFLLLALCQAAFAIFEGRNATIDEFPYMVSIKYSGKLSCAGVIIGPKHVVSIDTCVSGKPYNYLTVRAGSSYLGKGGVEVGVEKIYQASATDYRRHMAVIKLTEELEFSDTLKPIQMAAPGTKIPKSLTTAGWGSTYVSSYKV